MTREEAMLWMRVLKHSKINWVGEKAEEEDIIKRCEEAEQEAFDMAIEALSAEAVDCTDFIEWLVDRVLDETIWEYNSVAYGEIICRKLEKLGVLEVTEEPSYYIRPSADAVPIVYCMDCAKSEPLDEHGALWKCKAHDRTTLRHSYCNNGERKGVGDK